MAVCVSGGIELFVLILTVVSQSVTITAAGLTLWAYIESRE